MAELATLSIYYLVHFQFVLLFPFKSENNGNTIYIYITCMTLSIYLISYRLLLLLTIVIDYCTNLLQDLGTERSLHREFTILLTSSLSTVGNSFSFPVFFFLFLQNNPT